ncbi:thiamine pyrophosphate-binding protein [Streptomyces sp. R-07]|uniref:thiamine pyrophosphate-binding protein n=1 Tax=Streptomyces sp. R-07 TaxID=3404052 RepID=UPI003CEFCF0F
MKVSDHVLERLRDWEVEYVFAYPGDGINGLLAAWGRAENRPWFVQARHEEMSAFEAVGYAKFSGRTGVCAATSGPGAIHLLNGLYDAKLDHVPVVAIVGQTDRSAMGGSYQQEVDLAVLASGTRVRSTMVQMPAVNTPQFDWVRSRLPERAQPVPPVYQPEVAARAVLYAADHPRRREYWVGGSTVATLVANAVAPGLLDRYLARTGFDAQQDGSMRPAGEPDNLFAPVDAGRDFGAHGRFDERARRRSRQQVAAHALGTLAGVLSRMWGPSAPRPGGRRM